MNSKQYNNIINHTLVNEPAAQTEDSLTTARAIFNNMGVALPSGDLPEIMEVLQTNEYMGWKACTREEAQQAANNGIAAIGIRADQIVILAAEDEDEPVAQTASIMTASATSDPIDPEDYQYYGYIFGTITTWYVHAIRITHTTGVNVRYKPYIYDNTQLRDADHNPIQVHSGEVYALLQLEAIEDDDNRKWYKILYNGMVAYVAAQYCVVCDPSEKALPEPPIVPVRYVEVSTGMSEGVGIRSTAEKTDSNLIGRIPAGTIVGIMSELRQGIKIADRHYDNWYAVRATINDTDTFGWCEQSHLFANYGVYKDGLEADQIETAMSNLQNYTGFAKRDTCLVAARALLEAGYSPSIVAGMLGNIEEEGSTGQFEGYRDAAHLNYVNSRYVRNNYYKENISGRTIMQIGLDAAEALVNWIETSTSGTWKYNDKGVGCGIGCCQWTSSRSKDLVEEYRLANGNNNQITIDVARQAEVALLLREFRDNTYCKILNDWGASYGTNGSSWSAAAAKHAAKELCRRYLIPDDTEAEATSRASKAETIYNAMMVSITKT